jgi:hypothetical protein
MVNRRDISVTIILEHGKRNLPLQSDVHLAIKPFGEKMHIPELLAIVARKEYRDF